MEIRPDDLIQQYYSTIKAQYPHLTSTDINTICKHPYVYTSKRMASKDYDVIKLRGLGKFQVYETKIIKAINVLTNSFKRGLTNKHIFNHRINQFQSILTAITQNEGITIIDDTPNPLPPLHITNDLSSNLTKSRPDNIIRRQTPNNND